MLLTASVPQSCAPCCRCLLSTGQEQDSGLPLTNKTPRLMPACQIRSTVDHTRAHTHTHTHTCRHTRTHAHTHTRLLETNGHTSNRPLVIPFMSAAARPCYKPCRDQSSRLTNAVIVFCRRFICGRPECRSGAGAGSSRPPPSRQRGSRLRVSEEVLVLRAASVRGPCGDVNRRVVSETSGSPARLITGLPK